MSANHDSSHGSHGSLRSYTVGLIISIILTVIPFVMVMKGSLTPSALMAVVWILAVVQIAIQAIYFLHLDRNSEGGWNILSLWFTILMVGLVVVGSLWIMFHLHMNTMMPMATS